MQICIRLCVCCFAFFHVKPKFSFCCISNIEIKINAKTKLLFFVMQEWKMRALMFIFYGYVGKIQRKRGSVKCIHCAEYFLCQIFTQKKKETKIRKIQW